MKTMKLITMLFLSILFIGCNNDDCETPSDKTKSVVIKVITEPSTKSEGSSAIGGVPELYDLTLYFHNGSKILAIKKGTLGQIDGQSGEEFKIPEFVTSVFIGANKNRLGTPNIAISEGDFLSKLNKILVNITGQIDPQSGVNLKGQATLANGVTTVGLKPAVARIEIKQIEGIGFQKFKVTGIYINNTYTQFGIDEKSAPSNPSYLINYGKYAPEWTNGNYNIYFKEESSFGLGAGSETDAIKKLNSDNIWGFFVAGTDEFAGTIIDGNPQGAVPHIIIKVEGAVDSDGTALDSPMYITLTEFVGPNNIDLTHLEAGKIYFIPSIKIAGNDLHSLPETESTATIQANVLAWIGVMVNPK